MTPTSTPLTGQAFSQLITRVANNQAELPELIEQLTPLINDRVLAPELALALSVSLHEIESHALQDDELYRLVNQQNAPAFAVNEAGTILTMNTASVDLFHQTSGVGLSDFGVTNQEFKAFRQRLAEVPGPTLLKVYRPNEHLTKLPLLMVGVYQHRLRAFILTALEHHWPPALDRALADLFQLSTSERIILKELSQGLNAERIAQKRNRAIGTVRQQIKTILQKLNTTNQLEAATLAGAAAHAMGKQAAQSDRLILEHTGRPMVISEFERQGRRIGWRRFGNPKGRKVILFHGPSFGAGDYVNDRDLANKHNLDIIALERPGYGRTHTPNRNEDPLSCQLDDAQALIDNLKLSEFTILAHEVGLIPALVLAEARPEQCRGILSVSAAPPFIELEQINAMPANQGIFIHAARHAPWLAKLLIRLLMVRIRKLGPEHWTDVIFHGVEPDMSVISRSEFRAGVIGSYSFYLNQMGAGFEVDLQIMLKDWAQMVSNCRVPLNVIHGTKNKTTPSKTLDIFRRLKPDINIELIDGEGLTLAISKTEHIYSIVNHMAKTDKEH